MQVQLIIGKLSLEFLAKDVRQHLAYAVHARPLKYHKTLIGTFWQVHEEIEGERICFRSLTSMNDCIRVNINQRALLAILSRFNQTTDLSVILLELRHP